MWHLNGACFVRSQGCCCGSDLQDMRARRLVAYFKCEQKTPTSLPTRVFFAVRFHCSMQPEEQENKNLIIEREFENWRLERLREEPGGRGQNSGKSYAPNTRPMKCCSAKLCDHMILLFLIADASTRQFKAVLSLCAHSKCYCVVLCVHTQSS